MKKIYMSLAAICTVAVLFFYLPGFKSKPVTGLVVTSTTDSSAKTVGVNRKDTSPVAPDAISKMYSDIEQREYNASYDSSIHSWQSPNRAHNIRAYYGPGHWELQNRVDSTGHNWQLQIKTLGVYADGQCLAKPDPACQAGAAAN